MIVKASSSCDQVLMIAKSLQIQMYNQQRLFQLVSMQMIACASYNKLRNHSDNRQYTKKIQSMYTTYHNGSLSLLEDEISFHQESEYIKRFYHQYEYSNKIILLSEYYQYHHELPRIFQKDIHLIIQNYQDDVRTLQYKFVKRKLKEETEAEGGFSHRPKSSRPVEKIIKNIELSYFNFEKKSIKKDNERETKSKQTALNKNKKSMPILPLYQYSNKLQRDKQAQFVTTQINLKLLGSKETHRNSNKQKCSQVKKKSACSSIESPKNLSRSKSKSNLMPLTFQYHNKRNSVKKLEIGQNKITSNNNIQCSQAVLQKTQSTKNIHGRKPLEEKNNVAIDCNKKEMSVNQKEFRKQSSKKDSSNKEAGTKSMFRKIMQTKKLIKLAK